jgi:hypothetical protein
MYCEFSEQQDWGKGSGEGRRRMCSAAENKKSAPQNPAVPAAAKIRWHF